MWRSLAATHFPGPSATKPPFSSPGVTTVRCASVPVGFALADGPSRTVTLPVVSFFDCAHASGRVGSVMPPKVDGVCSEIAPASMSSPLDVFQ